MKDGVVIGASVVMILAGVGLTIMLEPFANQPKTEAASGVQGDAPMATNQPENGVMPPAPVIDNTTPPTPEEMTEAISESSAQGSEDSDSTSPSFIPPDEDTNPDEPVPGQSAQNQNGQVFPPAPVIK
jgi:hypothetical protein